ncbi:MAG: hypothetical protein RIB45_11550 [Marivibrio sp.]|uniref:hypothetical protein n=1 Tax=Marivibrio sp. TaxID=2039719 RepID=UPI0032EEF9F5
MTDLSREELRAHLSAVEAQVRAALRIVAAESKSVQQAHSSLRADLSAALIRLQSEMNSGSGKIDNKLDRVLSDVNSLGRQRKLTTAILTTLVLLFGVTVGVLAGGSWYFLQQNQAGANVSLPTMEERAPPRDSAAAAQSMVRDEPALSVEQPASGARQGASAAGAAASPEPPPSDEPSVRIITAE